MIHRQVALLLSAIILTACSRSPDGTRVPIALSPPQLTSAPATSTPQPRSEQPAETPTYALATIAPSDTIEPTRPTAAPTETEPPVYTPEVPDISLSQCITTAVRDPSRLIGMWMRWYGPGEKTQYELLYFRDEHVVSVWLGGGFEDIGTIEPWIEDGTYNHTNDRHIELTVIGTAYASLDYGICNDLLAVYNALVPSVGVYGYVRVPEMCWKYGDAYSDRCFFRLDN